MNDNGAIWVAASLGVLGLLLMNRGALASMPGLSGPYKPVQYPPNSPELIALLEQAAVAAGLPVWWARDKAAHELIRRESKGWIGRPNYTIPGAGDKTTWPATIAKLRAGQYIAGGSDAAGLGQLQPSNMKAFAPMGIKGFGVPLQEAIGFLRYVSSRYGSPEVALSMHGKLGKYVNARTGKTQSKDFKEGY